MYITQLYFTHVFILSKSIEMAQKTSCFFKSQLALMFPVSSRVIANTLLPTDFLHVHVHAMFTYIHTCTCSYTI